MIGYFINRIQYFLNISCIRTNLIFVRKGQCYEKNRWAALLIGLTIPAVFAGCGQGSNNTATDNKATVENKSETRTITDMAGREVEIPTTVNTIIP